MGRRDRFYEMLTSLSNVVIHDGHFEVSAPIQIQEAKTSVQLTPKANSHLYGARAIHYTRFDLSATPVVTLVSNGEEHSHQIVERLQNHNFFKYRVINKNTPGIFKTRLLALEQEDISPEMVPKVFSHPVKIQLQASPESDFFIGTLTVELLPIP